MKIKPDELMSLSLKAQLESIENHKKMILNFGAVMENRTADIQPFSNEAALKYENALMKFVNQVEYEDGEDIANS